MRSALAHVPKGQQTVLAAALRQAFLQTDQDGSRQVWRRVADQLRQRWPKLSALMDESEHDVLAYMAFPARHRTKLHSTDVLDKSLSATVLSWRGRAPAGRGAGRRRRAPPGRLILMARPRSRRPCASCRA